MSQPTEVYVDPSIAADSGTGTSGDPYGDLEYAIEQTTFDTFNGTRVNIKAGTDEVLAADLNTALTDTVTTAAWVPAQTAPLVFQGYTTTAGDGGKGGISGNGSIKIFGGAQHYVKWIDMHLHNTGSAEIYNSAGQHHSFINCEIDNTTTNALRIGTKSLVFGCYIHNVGGAGVFTSESLITQTYFENGTNDFSYAIQQSTVGNMVALRNIIKIDGASVGIRLFSGGAAINNSIWSNAGTGIGIDATGSTVPQMVINNLCEGFSGAGGDGFNFGNSGTGLTVYGGNAAYDNTTEYTAPADYLLFDFNGSPDNETLSASPFTDATNGDFSPVDTGNVKEGALPATFGDGQHSGTGVYEAWKGAVEPAATGGGAPGHGNMQGGMQ